MRVSERTRLGLRAVLRLAVRDGSSWIFNPEESHPLRSGMTLVIMATPEGRRAVESALGWV